MKKLTLALGIFAALSIHTPAFGHDADKLGKLSGDQIDLAYTDHAVSGSIGGKAVFAAPFKTAYKVIYRLNGETHESEFGKVDDKFGGTFHRIDEKGKATTFAVIINPITEADTIEGTVANKAFKVTISAASVAGMHFINPTFDVEVDGKNFSYKLEDGEACPGCSARVAFVVLGMLEVSGVL